MVGNSGPDGEHCEASHGWKLCAVAVMMLSCEEQDVGSEGATEQAEPSVCLQ